MSMDDLFRDLSHLMNYRKQIPEEGFVDLMGKILDPLPGVGWEYGPDVYNPDIDRLSLSLRHAPAEVEAHPFFAKLPLSGDGWLIDKGIPPRDWEIYFLAVIDDQEREIEGSQWFCQMVEADGAVELKIGVPAGHLPEADSEDLGEMADLMVVGELGELNLAQFVKSIDVVRMEHMAERLPSMLSLRKNFVAKFPSCRYADWLATSR